MINESVDNEYASSRWTARTVRQVNKETHLSSALLLLATVNGPRKSMPMYENGLVNGDERAMGRSDMSGVDVNALSFLQCWQHFQIFF